MKNVAENKDKILDDYNDDFSQLISKNHQRIHTYCFHMLRNVLDAEDATQEVFVKAYNNLHKITKETNLSAWLYKIAYHHCLNVIKRQRLIKFIPFQPSNEPLAHNITTMHETEFSEEISDALRELSAKERTIIILKTVQELSYAEIEQIMSTNQPAVRKCYERARKKLKRYLLANENRRIKDEEISFL
ncbi:RNA polymerase sigma factor [Cytobacillus sp. Hm23]